MGGSSTPQNANAGNMLTNLFLSNQATPHVSTSPLVAPQSSITPGMFNVPQPTPPLPPQAPQPAQQPTAYNFGFGGQVDNTPHPFARGDFGAAGLGHGAYVAPPKPPAPQPPFQMPQTQLIAQNINKKYARK